MCNLEEQLERFMNKSHQREPITLQGSSVILKWMKYRELNNVQTSNWLIAKRIQPEVHELLYQQSQNKFNSKRREANTRYEVRIKLKVLTIHINNQCRIKP